MNTNGAVTGPHTYDAYGSLIASNGVTPNDILYHITDLGPPGYGGVLETKLIFGP